MSDLLKPEIYCPIDKEKVPIWYCLGSFLQGKPTCRHLEEATVRIAENFCEVKCRPRRESNIR